MVHSVCSVRKESGEEQWDDGRSSEWPNWRREAGPLDTVAHLHLLFTFPPFRSSYRPNRTFKICLLPKRSRKTS